MQGMHPKQHQLCNRLTQLLSTAGGIASCSGMQYLESNGEEGQVDVLPAEGVQQGCSSVHCSRHSVPLLGHQDDSPLQQQRSQQSHEALHRHMPQQASQWHTSIPGSIPKVWGNLQLNELVRAACSTCMSLVDITMAQLLLLLQILLLSA